MMSLAPSLDLEPGLGSEPVPHALAAGGRMSQRIATDLYGIDAWDQSNGVDDWGEITGARPPTWAARPSRCYDRAERTGQVEAGPAAAPSRDPRPSVRALWGAIGLLRR